MINLLPQQWQKKLADEEACKTAAILGIIAIAALLAFILMMLLARVIYLAELEALDIAAAEKEQEMNMIKVGQMEKETAAKKQLTAKIGDFYDQQVRVSVIFRGVAGSLPSGVVLSDFGYSSGKVSLGGFAVDRESLVAFKGNLEKQADFANVNFPPENWLSAKDIKFSANFNYAADKNNK